MMKNNYRKIGICILLFLSSISMSRAGHDNIRLKVTDQKGEALLGVYLVYARNHMLLATTDDNGESYLDLKGYSSSDTVCFSCLGFHDERISVGDLGSYRKVVLKEKNFFLGEAVVRRVSPSALLENISGHLLKGRSKVDHYRYYGNGLYEKITECKGKAVEYRREYGCFLTIGNAEERPNFDYGGNYEFIPRYTARSYPLSEDGKDTLHPLYMRYPPFYYQSGDRKLFQVIRNIELYGPLLGGTDFFDFKCIEVNGNDYTYQFSTKKSCYRTKTNMYCRGILVADYETNRLKSISMDYIEHDLCNIPRWQEKRMKDVSLVSKASMEFAYTGNGQYYVKSALLTSNWKDIKDGRYSSTKCPSRKNPGPNQLVEKEAFLCRSFQNIPSMFMAEPRFLSVGMVAIAAYNPQGEYKAKIFESLPVLLDTKKVFDDLSTYMDIYRQFEKMSNRPYYGEDYLLSSRWITNKRMFDNNFCKKFGVARMLFLKCFFKE